MGFETLRMTIASTALTTVPTMDISMDAQPLLTFNLASHDYFHSFKRNATMVLRPRAHTTATTTTRRTTIRMSQPSPITKTIILTLTTIVSIMVSLVTNTIVQIAPTIVTASDSNLVPLAFKGKAMIMDDDMDLPLFSFKVGATSARPTLSHY